MRPLNFLSIAILLASSIGFAQNLNYKARAIRITTFNIRYFGLGGAMSGTPQAEHRDQNIHDFLAKEIPSSDVYVFEEIVDVPRLRKLMPVGWSCLSYNNPDPAHQHVMICASPNLVMTKEPNDDNYLIDAVAIDATKSRPAVTTILTDRAGNVVLRVVAVHLKAFPDFASTRVKQANVITDYLTKVRNPRIPVVIVGDMNTYKMPTNKSTADDTTLLSTEFAKGNLGIHWVPQTQFTWRGTATSQSQFDQFYISKGLNIATMPSVFRFCNEANVNGAQYDNAQWYYDNISDHCPVTATISIQ